MVNDTSLFAFIILSIVVLIVPGPGVLYVVARSLGQGYLAAIISAAGLALGVLVHVFAAVVGLSAILLSSTTAFLAVKYIGAGYLIYLGIQAIRRQDSRAQPDEVDHIPPIRLFLDGIVVSAFNPKIAVFFLAFFPQFVRADTASPELQILMLGLLYACLAFVTDSCYGLTAVSIKRFMHHKTITGRTLQILSGSAMIGLGIKVAISTSRQ